MLRDEQYHQSGSHERLISFKGNKGSPKQYREEEDGRNSGAADPGSSNLGSLGEGLSSSKYLQQHQQVSNGYGFFDDVNFDVDSPPVQQCFDEMSKLSKLHSETPAVEPRKEAGSSVQYASLELLNSYGSGVKRLSELRPSPSQARVESSWTRPKLSIDEILKTAAVNFISSSSHGVDGSPILSGAAHGVYFSGLTDDQMTDVELLVSLLSAAESVGNQQFERASRLLSQCEFLSSPDACTVQRVVHYFTEALRERIDRETGNFTSNYFKEKQACDLNEAMKYGNPITLSFYQDIPLSQASHFTGIQAIVEHVATAKKIHMIDFGLRHGVHSTILMQALAARHEAVEHLKITAVTTTSRSKLEPTGTRLLSFARTMKIPLSFDIVMIGDMLDLREELFELDGEEEVVVYAPLLMTTLVAQRDRLDHLMSVLKNLDPCLMVMAEVEANHNSPAFVNRFIEALFFYSAYFDFLASCMENDNPGRIAAETVFFSRCIRNIVATEGADRTTRHVKIGVWRSYFARFGLVETEFSAAATYQARLVLDQFSCGSSCTIDTDGKSLIMGWKGTPLHSLSIWKFM
uniref:Uncharacterized protein n=1 Tax=Kalanchoe fedtschenkoi TaxID=63787 RepID=A0A7N0UBR7_KALFE